MIQCNQHI